MDVSHGISDFMGKDRMKRISLLILFLVAGCVTQPLDINTLYRKDLQVKIDQDKHWSVGAVVLDKKDRYDFNFWFYKKPTKFVLTTCHREVVFSNPGGSLKYTYMPDPKLEQTEFCPIEVAAFDDGGQHSWGMIDFRSGFEKLHGWLTCNGEKEWGQDGVSFCQSKSKLTQRVAFDVPVKGMASSDCPALKPLGKDGKEFTFEMGRGKCLYVFKAADQIHRLITFGYDDVILR